MTKYIDTTSVYVWRDETHVHFELWGNHWSIPIEIIDEVTILRFQEMSEDSKQAAASRIVNRRLRS